MKWLSDELLVETYQAALILGLSDDFIKLVYMELEARGLLNSYEEGQNRISSESFRL
ncbi:Sporulation inhibitor A [Halobacillus alkaliphilus]|uniref:Sporulation inhibitor A n=1 Tax=Halobacillus alkaliphilus TaxID=396056 RepID=A0A1I2M9A9_9BACI|nr:sporulation histidine kinase inhibitor Sda [Halobacillus alkaliphilus]SFF88065.1 Sporulation inhibitor A [Halobacillus alkaliphilus]